MNTYNKVQNKLTKMLYWLLALSEFLFKTLKTLENY